MEPKTRSTSPGPADNQEAPAKSKAKILTVDDEIFNLKLLRAHLGKNGYAVIEATNGKQALEKAADLDNRPDLVLLDIMMPEMDGLEVCRRLKLDPLLKDIPVIFLSALGDVEVKSTGLELGGVDFISKPFDARELLARVQTHILLNKQAAQIQRYAANLEDIVQERTSQLRQAEEELKRDFDIQSVIDGLLRLSLDELPLVDILHQALNNILALTSLSFLPRGGIFLDGEDRTLRLAAQVGLDPEVVGCCEFVPFGRCVCGLAAAENKIQIITADDPRHEFTRAPLLPHGHVCVPISNGERLLGVLNVLLKKDHLPDNKEIEFFGAATATLSRIIIYKETRERLAHSEKQYRTIFEKTGAGMAIVESDATLSLVNARFEDFAGITKAEIEGRRSLFDFVHADDQPGLLELHRTLREDPETLPALHEFRFVSPVHGVRDMALTLSKIPGANRSVASLADITDRKNAERKLRHHAFYDALTDLPNRVFLLDSLAAQLERVRTTPEHGFALLLLDIDRFYLVNESLGHSIGDQLIVELARRLESFLDTTDLLVRMGGDEFGLLLDGADSTDQATDLAAHVLNIARQPYHLSGQELVNTCSIGIALSTIGYHCAEDVIRDADTALYRAKRQGKARAVVFDREMHLKALGLLQLVTDMRQAIKRNEFLLHFQPIVAMDTLAATGFESLIRWKHPQRGMVSPAEFIPEAEESGLIIPIGRWVLEESCRCMKRIFNDCEAKSCQLLSVNLSGKQFTQPDLFEQIRATLDATGFEPSCLKLEITESVIMEDAAAAVEVLCKFKSLNIQISIDDFGTGYSSLSYLHRFPVDMIKIDRSFVGAMCQGGENLEIVRTIVNLAHNLGMQVIAEGVETREQLDMLRAMGCEYCQGYYFSKPVPPETVVEQRLCTRTW